MDSQQRLVAWLAGFLVMFAIWRFYKPTLSTILFDTPANNTSITGSFAGVFSGLGSSILGAGENTVSGGLIGPSDPIQLPGTKDTGNPWAPFPDISHW